MAGKSAFTEEQREVLHETGKRVWARFQREGRSQEDMALAMGIAQQSVSNMLKGTYSPGINPARQLANLDGKTLEQLIGHIGPEIGGTGASGYPGLDVCVRFHETSKTWHPWTIAAARAGIFGPSDFPAPAWAAKLDRLEASMEKVRKGV